MNTVLVRYGHFVVQNNIQKTWTQNAKWKNRYIDEKDIVQWLGKTFSIFCQLAAKWRRIAFVYDVIGNMAILTFVDAVKNKDMAEILLNVT